MVKKPDIKRRKNLRLAMCALFLLQIVICTMPFYQTLNDKGQLITQSPFGMIIIFFSVVTEIGSNMISPTILSLLLILIPTAGFFICALDKERNLKNIVSIILCLAAVFIILMFPKETVSLGAMIAMILYIIISFLTSMAMVLRLSNEE